MVASLARRRRDFARPRSRRALAQVRGIYAIACCATATRTQLVAAQERPRPLVIGLGEGENFVASDVPACCDHTREVIFLEDGDLAEIRADGVEISAWTASRVQRTA